MSIRMFAICAAILVGVPVRPSIGAEGKDYPGLGRIEGYKIDRYEDRRFDRHNFPLSDRQMPIEGHVISIRYVVDGSGPTASSLLNPVSEKCRQTRQWAGFGRNNRVDAVTVELILNGGAAAP